MDKEELTLRKLIREFVKVHDIKAGSHPEESYDKNF